MKMNDRNHYDTVVIGAGPAGSTAAALMAEAGLRVLVLEREKPEKGAKSEKDKKGKHPERGEGTRK